MIDLRLREVQARAICDSKLGVGHFDRPTTKRGHWRRLAEEKTCELQLEQPPTSRAARAWAWFVRAMGVEA